MSDFGILQTHLAVMVGAQSADELPPAEQAQVKQVINQMYRWCYTPPDASRPHWATREARLKFPGPKIANLTLTAGSDAFTSDVALSADQVGSFVLLPNKVRSRLDSVSQDGLSGTLVTTADETGSIQATVYGNVSALPTDTVDVEKHPLCDERILTPLDDREQERIHHSVTEDFGLYRVRTGLLEVDEPVHYFVDETIVGGVIRPRLAVYPIPEKNYDLSVRINVAPEPLVEDEDVPKLPLDVVEDVLVPMARAKFAEITPRYNSKNIQYLINDRNDALKRLKSFSQKQKGHRRRLAIRPGF